MEIEMDHKRVERPAVGAEIKFLLLVADIQR